MRSSTLMPAEGGRLHAARLRVAAAALIAAGLLALVAGSPPAAHAEFTLKACEGGAIQGEGSSLQKVAQLSYWSTSEVFGSPQAPGCGQSGLAPQVTYQSKSSGCGLDAMGAGDPSAGCTFQANPSFVSEPKGYRDGTDRFGASDFAPNPEEEANIDNGPAGGQQAGKIHIIPVAGAAISVVVHFPEGCALQNPEGGSGNGDTSTGGANDPSGKGTGDKFSNQTLRVHIEAKKLEEVWEGDLTTWGQIVPSADFLEKATNGVSKSQSECASTPIIRIVRFDTSGTTFNFKAYLSLLPSPGNDGGAKLWTSGPVAANSTEWPVTSPTDTEVPHPVNVSNECVEASHICKAAAEGGGSLASAVEKTNGSIGYLDLATAREKHFDMTENKTGEPGVPGFEETKNDRLYWIPLQTVNPEGNVIGADYVEPTADPTAHDNPLGLSSTKGANCSGADYRGIPSTPSDPTLGDWSSAIATGGTTYPVCAITYDLAFDDDAPVYGNTAPEQEKARTVKDYLTAVVDNGGGLRAFDYATLPLSLITDAQNGVAAIGWNKTSGAGGKTEEVVKPPVVGAKTGTTTPTPTPTTPPSNSFSIASAKVKGKNIVLSLVLPDAGKVQIKATGGGVTVSNVTANVSGGQGTVTLPISSAALKKLAKAKGKKLSVSITVTFTPTGGTAATQKKTLTITQASIAGKSKKTKKKKGTKKG
jgi:ABC-type phosphate transport system substrate-binding protein